jgi:hypothetical protein
MQCPDGIPSQDLLHCKATALPIELKEISTNTVSLYELLGNPTTYM